MKKQELQKEIDRVLAIAGEYHMHRIEEKDVVIDGELRTALVIVSERAGRLVTLLREISDVKRIVFFAYQKMVYCDNRGNKLEYFWSSGLACSWNAMPRIPEPIDVDMNESKVA
jgi:hypothetical protein